MWKNFKKGFGWISGILIGYATLGMISEKIMKWGAKDEKYMERLKDQDPILYEKLKKYQPKKTEDSKEEEEAQ